MTRSGRVLLPVLLGLVVPAAVVFLVYSVTHLIGSATTYHVRVVARPAGAATPTAAEVARLAAEQNHWGVLAMFAVMAVAGSLVLTLVVWLLAGQQAAARRRLERR